MTEPTEISRIFGASLIGSSPNADKQTGDRSNRRIPVEKADLPRFRECMRYLRSMWQLPEITEDDGHAYGGLVADIGIDKFEYALKSYARDTTIEHGRQRCVIKPTVTRLFVQHREIQERADREQQRQESQKKSASWQQQSTSPEQSKVWLERIRRNQENALRIKRSIQSKYNLKSNDNRLHNISNEVFKIAQNEKCNEGWHEVDVNRYMELAEGIAPKHLKEKNNDSD